MVPDPQAALTVARRVSDVHTTYHHLLSLFLYWGSGFNLRDEMSEVKTVLEGDGEDGTKCHTLHRRYQSLVREYKRMERRLVECQKKQLEVCRPVCLCAYQS